MSHFQVGQLVALQPITGPNGTLTDADTGAGGARELTYGLSAQSETRTAVPSSNFS